MGKSYLGPIRNVPRLCPAVVLPSEKLVSQSTAEGRAMAFPWKSWGRKGTSGSGCAVLLLLRALETWDLFYSLFLGDENVSERWKV